MDDRLFQASHCSEQTRSDHKGCYPYQYPLPICCHDVSCCRLELCKAELIAQQQQQSALAQSALDQSALAENDGSGATVALPGTPLAPPPSSSISCVQHKPDTPGSSGPGIVSASSSHLACQLGAVYGSQGDCCRRVGDVGLAEVLYRSSAECLRPHAAEDPEVRWGGIGLRSAVFIRKRFCQGCMIGKLHTMCR